jgi:hypothetical protein
MGSEGAEWVARLGNRGMGFGLIASRKISMTTLKGGKWIRNKPRNVCEGPCKGQSGNASTFTTHRSFPNPLVGARTPPECQIRKGGAPEHINQPVTAGKTVVAPTREKLRLTAGKTVGLLTSPGNRSWIPHLGEGIISALRKGAAL